MALSSNYVSNVPQGNQQVNNTQQPINGNFQDIYSLLAVNHVPFNTVDTFGKHTFVSYVQQTDDPETSSTEMALYSKQVSNDPNGMELFYRYPNNGNIVQLTGVVASSVPTGGNGASSGGSFIATVNGPFSSPVSGYWQYLSNGLLFMTYISAGYYQTPPTPTTPYITYFPSGTYSGGIVVPQFTQPPFNIQLTGQGQGTSGTDVNYAATIIDNKSAHIYYKGTIPPAPSSIASVTVTLIGI